MKASATALSLGLFLCVPFLASAAPQLRLSQNSLGPIPIATGAAGPATTPYVEAFNSGDGTLTLRASASVPWITPRVGTPGNCLFRIGTCTPIQFGIQAASLAKGTYTGAVTVSDPAAVDSPQTVTVTLQVGGGVPDAFNFFVAANSSRAESVFSTASPINIAVATQSGGDWLSYVTEGGNPFRPGTTYRVIASVPPGTSEGTYNGTLTTSGSSLAGENKAVPVTLRVTSQPIAQLSQETVTIRAAQGSARQTVNLAVSNRGLGTIGVTGATISVTSGSGWLSADTSQAGVVAIAADPTGLSPGTYNGSVSIASNAAQGAIAVPVRMDVVAASAPVASYRGVVNNATFEGGDVVSQGSIVAVFGEQFTTGAPALASAVPLPTDLGGARVFVNNQPAPLYYVSATQINFQLPYDAAPGDAVVRVERDGQRGNDVSVRIARGAPRLLRLGIGDYPIALNQDGTFPTPTRSAPAGRPAKVGDTLVFYAIGVGPTTPTVQTGVAAPSSPLARASGNYRMTLGSTGPFGVGSVDVVPGYVGLTPNFVGLYQINVTIPAEAPKGAAVPVLLASDENGVSNTVTIAIE